MPVQNPLIPCGACQQVIDHLNTRAAKRYRAECPTTVKLLHQRHKDHGLDACLDVVDFLVDKWFTDNKMRQYLRPATIFNKRVFESRYADIKADAGAE